MELRTEGDQAIIIKHNGINIGVISQLDTENLKAYRIVFDVFKFEDKIGSAIDVFFMDDGQESEIGTFEIEKRKFRCVGGGFIIINEAQLKRT